ncbi:MAG: lipopolysaccharide biosynthesis protein [Marinobacter sp.]|uniref:lipopolysaccharide biosynthesis protein n=2 Tax=Marinobacter sp. TaxID=50741 RepID=UPI003299A8D4
MNPRKIAAFAIGPIGGAVLGLITIPTITWFFSQEDVGRMSMMQVAIGFSTLLFSLGLDQAYVREFHEADNKPALLKQAILPGLSLLLVTLAILLTLGGTLANWLFEVDAWQLSWMVAIALLATFISRFLSLVLRMGEHGLAYSMSQVLPKLLLLAIISAFVFGGVDKSLSNLILANTSALVFVCAVFAFNTRKDWIDGLQANLNPEQFKSMLRFGLPLIASGLAFWSLTAVDKIFLRKLSSFEELGVYSVAVSFASAAVVLKALFSTVWVPTVYKWVASGADLEKISLVVRYVLLVVVFFFSVSGVFSGLVVLVLPDEYSDVRWILVACMAFPLFHLLSEATVVGIGITRKSSYALIAPSVSLIVNVIGNIWLIPRFGAAGAAASTSIAFFIFFVIRTEVSAYLWKMDNRLYLYGYSLICVLGAVMGALVGPHLGGWLLWYWLVVGLSLVFFFRTELSEAYRWVSARAIGRDRF